ncbi:MAG: metallophosphoesterase [Bryobacteraceae bacterium]|nr:metallophosphoesterase [Bryobacteraceae bacterium]MDW8379537.1 metallophosphoesterase [Bryobacterales bacterium]
MGLWATIYRSLPELIFLAIALSVHWIAFQRVRKSPWAALGLGVSALWVAASIFASLHPVVRFLPPGDFHYWWRGIGHLWGLTSLGALLVWLTFSQLSPRFSPARRRALNLAKGVVLASPALVTGYGVFHERRKFTVREVEIPVSALPADLHGLRIVQLSDIHFSPYLSESELAYVVDMANETKPHLAVVTGDLVTGRWDPVGICLLHLKRLKSDAGVFGCLGNHEIFAGCEQLATQMGADLGLHFLRQQSRTLRFGSAKLHLVGVDYQPFRTPYLVGVEKLVEPDAFNLLLSHNPDVFPVAAQQGFHLTLAGHTHGGQVTFEILHPWLNVARIFTPYVYGKYEIGQAALYVTRGIGTVGMPARIGAPPEIALIKLCAS